MSSAAKSTGEQRKGRAPRARRRATRAESQPAEVPDIIRALGEEHRYQLRLLRMMEKEVAALNLRQQPDYEVMHGVMRYMTQYPDRFHHPKEDLVFAKVVQRDPSAKAEVNALLEAHTTIIAQGSELLELVDRCRADPGKADTHALRKSAHAYIGSLRRHMDIEMLRVFPRAQQVLRPADWAEVDARMKPILDPVFGDTSSASFQTLREKESHRPEAESPGALQVGLIEAAALIETVSTLIAGVTRVNRKVARHHRETLNANAAMMREVMREQSLSDRVRLAGRLMVRNAEMVRDVNRRVVEIWSQTLRAARRPYEEEGPYAAKLLRPCSSLARRNRRSAALADANPTG